MIEIKQKIKDLKTKNKPVASKKLDLNNNNNNNVDDSMDIDEKKLKRKNYKNTQENL